MEADGLLYVEMGREWHKSVKVWTEAEMPNTRCTKKTSLLACLYGLETMWTFQGSNGDMVKLCFYTMS